MNLQVQRGFEAKISLSILAIDMQLQEWIMAAMKQSRKAWLPKVNAMVPFRKFIEQPRAGRKFIAHCYEEIERKDFFNRLMEIRHAPEADPTEEITILVGPEGDFSIDEVRLAQENGYESVSLGESRLRTETAGLVAVVMANLGVRC